MQSEMCLDRQADSQKLNMRITLVLWWVGCLAAMIVMLYTAGHKPVKLVENAADRIILNEEELSIKAYSAQKLLFREEGADIESIRIPVAKGIRAEDIGIDNRYTQKQLRISIHGAAYDFYNENPVTGDLTGILGGEFLVQDDGLILIIHTKQPYEFSTMMNDGELLIRYAKMSDVYDMVVILDPIDADEERWGTPVLDVALTAAENPMPSGIKVLVTRFYDIPVSEAERVRFARETGANAYIGIGFQTRQDETLYGLSGVYNDEYFIPDFGSLQLADTLLKSVAKQASNRADSLTEASEESIIKRFTIPAAQIWLGNLSNEREKQLILQKEYQNLLANGISDAIIEMYEIMSEK